MIWANSMLIRHDIVYKLNHEISSAVLYKLSNSLPYKIQHDVHQIMIDSSKHQFFSNFTDNIQSFVDKQYVKI